jgi:colicin import membrane protein
LKKQQLEEEKARKKQELAEAQARKKAEREAKLAALKAEQERKKKEREDKLAAMKAEQERKKAERDQAKDKKQIATLREAEATQAGKPDENPKVTSWTQTEYERKTEEKKKKMQQVLAGQGERAAEQAPTTGAIKPGDSAIKNSGDSAIKK